MNDKNDKLIRVTEHVAIPVPLGLTPDQEIEYVARYMATTSPEELDASAREWEQLLRDFEEGRTVPAQQVLRELDELRRDEAGPAPPLA
jgi:hypothetical protein